ncbi:MAG TPA: SCO6880 family protein [Acidimicrobiales bacterium]|nr:SCO6880 family protein [Acidimicrobiales bacterium]
MPETEGPNRTYRFGPLERRGMVAGLTTGQVASVGVGLVGAVLVLRLAPSGPGTVAAATLLVAGVAGALVSVGGRGVDEWVPVVIRWAALRGTARRRWVTDAASLGIYPVRRESSGGEQVRPPRLMSGCRLGEVFDPSTQRAIGVVDDRSSGTATAVLSVRGGGFALLDRTEKDQRVGGWAAVLAGLARDGSPVHRIQWIERVLPPSEEVVLELPRADGAGASSYAELVRREGSDAPVHEVLVGLTVRRPRHRRSRQCRDATEPVGLERELLTLESNLRGAGIAVDGPLGPTALGAAMAVGFGRSRHQYRSPWPSATEASWGWLRTDAWWHVTYWVAEWPRADVGPDFLTPLLLLGSGVRTVAAILEPVPPRRATREVEAARTAGVADDELRRRGGFLATARRQRQQSGIADREVELADGHADYRFSGYVTVSAPGIEQLESCCSEVEHAAGQARLQLRRLYGQQDAAFAYTLPMGRGLG